ncbi:aspartate/glutamate racemase family protein [Nocardioides ginsengisoli]|uniref:Aspartate racemase n=2 Tax=Nocardioides TaxID=1839 RepID=A0A852RLT9_9ACTN|nr:amino acid racemase [Nocardioides kongjuensis]NYD31995.1 aspartate racemase [Nocardioides kongjuensis]
MNTISPRLRTIGLVGGMSWHSTVTYYRMINEAVATVVGGHASASIALQSVNFAEIRDCQVREDWDRAAELLAEAAQRCVAGGAEILAICTNLMHKVAPQVEDAIDVPLLHIGDAVAAQASRNGWRTLGVLATQWVMDESFYESRLKERGIDTVMPDPDARQVVDGIIWDELTQGVVREESRRKYVEVIRDLADRGAQAVVLACTEIGLLIGPDDSPIPIIDSAVAHAEALASAALLSETGTKWSER